MDVTHEPKRVALGYLALLHFLFSPLALADDGIDFQVIHLRVRPASGPTYVAIRSREQWDALVKSSAPTAPVPVAPPSTIDFDRYTLRITDAGGKPSGGYFIVFTSVRDLHGEAIPTITVFILDLGPGTCPRTADLTNPIAFALIPKTSQPIRFVVSNADSNCNSPRTTVGETR
jgi:hypothetical protein